MSTRVEDDAIPWGKHCHDVLKDLDNSPIHPNNGDTSQQTLLDSELLALVKQVFLHLLGLIYEVPPSKKTTLAAPSKTAICIER